MKHQKGQGLVEYVMILVLVAVVVIVILAILGPAVEKPFVGLSIQLRRPTGETFPSVVDGRPLPATEWVGEMGTESVEYGCAKLFAKNLDAQYDEPHKGANAYQHCMALDGVENLP